MRKKKREYGGRATGSPGVDDGGLSPVCESWVTGHLRVRRRIERARRLRERPLKMKIEFERAVAGG